MILHNGLAKWTMAMMTIQNINTVQYRIQSAKSPYYLHKLANTDYSDTIEPVEYSQHSTTIS